MEAGPVPPGKQVQFPAGREEGRERQEGSEKVIRWILKTCRAPWPL